MSRLPLLLLWWLELDGVDVVQRPDLGRGPWMWRQTLAARVVPMVWRPRGRRKGHQWCGARGTPPLRTGCVEGTRSAHRHRRLALRHWGRFGDGATVGTAVASLPALWPGTECAPASSWGCHWTWHKETNTEAKTKTKTKTTQKHYIIMRLQHITMDHETPKTSCTADGETTT